MSYRKWTQEKAIKMIQEQYETTGALRGLYNPALNAYAVKSFGSWCNACAAAGLGEHVARKTYAVNEDLFSEGSEWTDAKAWLLGVIWSDGSIRWNTLQMGSIDLQLMEDFKKALGFVGSIKKSSSPSRQNNQPFYEIGCVSKKTVSDLKKLGLHKKKSLTIDYPKELPDEYFWSFFRGLIDGDGCVYLVRVKVSGKIMGCKVSLVTASKFLKNALSSKLTQFDIQHSIFCRGQYLKNGSMDKYWTGNNKWNICILVASHKEVYDLMYHSVDVPCLRRKKDKFTKGVDRRINCLWTEDEKDELVRLFPIATWDELMKTFPGRKRRMIMDKAYAMSLRRKKKVDRKEYENAHTI